MISTAKSVPKLRLGEMSAAFFRCVFVHYPKLRLDAEFEPILGVLIEESLGQVALKIQAELQAGSLSLSTPCFLVLVAASRPSNSGLELTTGVFEVAPLVAKVLKDDTSACPSSLVALPQTRLMSPEVTDDPSAHARRRLPAAELPPARGTAIPAHDQPAFGAADRN